MFGLLLACLVCVDYDLISEPTRFVNVPLRTNYTDRFELSLRTSNVKDLNRGTFTLCIAIEQTIKASKDSNLDTDDILKRLAYEIDSQEAGSHLIGWDCKTVISTLKWQTRQDLLYILEDLSSACVNILIGR